MISVICRDDVRHVTLSVTGDAPDPSRGLACPARYCPFSQMSGHERRPATSGWPNVLTASRGDKHVAPAATRAWLRIPDALSSARTDPSRSVPPYSAMVLLLSSCVLALLPATLALPHDSSHTDHPQLRRTILARSAPAGACAPIAPLLPQDRLDKSIQNLALNSKDSWVAGE